MSNINSDKAKLRLLRFLSRGSTRLPTDFVQTLHHQTSQVTSVRLQNSKSSPQSYNIKILQALEVDGLVRVDRETVSLTREGRAHIRRALSVVDEFQTQHRQTMPLEIVYQEERIRVESNILESPLARLRMRKQANGKPFLEEHEFRAGERLRSDFTRAGLMQGISSNWNAAIREGGRSKNTNGQRDLSDTAIDCRARVECAVAAIGPELSGALLDICCFLKGLEKVERERQWPPRSAKLMLKAGLSALSRHYGISPKPNGKSHKISHWGDFGYQPRHVPGEF